MSRRLDGAKEAGPPRGRGWRAAIPTAPAILVAGLAAACGQPLSVEATSAAYGHHRAAWEAAGVRDYRYLFQRRCECPPEMTAPVEIEVRGGAVEAVMLSQSGAPVSPELLPAFPTVDDLFDLIDEALRRDADLLEVTYDSPLGYPTSLRIDYRREVADDEVDIEAWGLRPL